MRVLVAIAASLLNTHSRTTTRVHIFTTLWMATSELARADLHIDRTICEWLRLERTRAAVHHDQPKWG